ncbi:Beta-galactosidase [Candidatus Lokiarchaeum ossiferum]|uniref:Beta-galactosidase n=1 Tax=Candidatus Lokiarchaeum ossiferum TaxID=2951803 RepID=A0ABY6HV24_9ARCH|nr:Beta-galactosidase [Candidatus Lokiarchaeum sp. B-35]
MEDVISLTGELWRFAVDPNGEGIEQEWFLQENQPYLEEKTRIAVPSCWNRRSSTEFKDYEGVAWYWRTFRTPKSFSNKKVFLFFAQIAHKATIYIDGLEIGSFHGAFLPFKFDISKFADNNTHFLAIRIDGKPDANRYISTEKVTEYFGIFGEVYIRTEKTLTLEERSMETVLRYDEISHKLNFAELTFSFYVKNAAEEDYTGEISIKITRDYVPVINIKRPIDVLKKNSRLSKIVVHINKEDLELWTPKSPNLYKLSVRIGNDEGGMIYIDENIGIREINVIGEQIMLNGAPFEIQGGDFPIDSEKYGYSNPRIDILDRFKRMKNQNINTIRSNQGILTPFIIELASRYGFLTLVDIPVTHLTTNEKQTFFNDYIDAITYQPSVALYTINFVLDPSDPKLNKLILDYEKMFTNRLDPTRYFLPVKTNFEAKTWYQEIDGKFIDTLK